MAETVSSDVQLNPDGTGKQVKTLEVSSRRNAADGTQLVEEIQAVVLYSEMGKPVSLSSVQEYLISMDETLRKIAIRLGAL